MLGKILSISIFCFFITGYKAQEINSDPICTEAELNEAISDTETCEKRADSEFTLLLRSGETNVKGALCDTIVTKTNCIREILPRCLPQANLTRLELVVLDDHAQRALNNSNILGLDFVNNCPIFQERLFGRYMLYYTGKLTCEYIDFTRNILPKKRQCDKVIDDKLIDAISISSFLTGAARVQFLESAACEAYNNWINICREPLIDQCYDNKNAQRIRKKDDDFYEDLEANFQNVNPTFKFSRTCTGSKIVEEAKDGEEAVDLDVEFLNSAFTRRRKRSIGRITIRNAEQAFHNL